MTRRGWVWRLAVVGVCAVLAVLLVLAAEGPVHVAVGLTGLAVVVAAWLLLGTRAHADEQGWRVIVLQLAMVAGCALAAAGHPLLAAAQAVGYPVLWTTSANRRHAIGASALLAVAVGIGMALGLGLHPGGVVSGAITAAFSLAFSIAMGLWIWSISDESDARRTLLAELQAAQQQLAAASRDAGVASERERFAREIHDTVAQDLTGIVMGLRRLATRLGDHPAAAEAARLGESAESALAEARALVAASAPPSIEDGAAAALGRLGERFGREAGLRASVEVDPALGPLPRETEVVLVRVAQEALANVRKHAGASAVSVSLEPAEGDAAVRLRVADDGHGFDPARTEPGGFGLEGMRERLALVGGELHVASAPSGTTLTATIPLRGAP